MQRIDAHQHFWKYDPVRDGWMTDEMGAIKKDFLPQDLQPLLRQNGFDGCVAVQADQSEEETNFLLALARENDFIKGVVGWVDFSAPDVEERLSRYKGGEKLKGFRHVLQSEAQRDFMLREDFLRGIGVLQRHGFTYDILIYQDQLPFVPQLIKRFPEQPFVLDHIAKPPIKTGDLKAWKEGIKALSGSENLWCKVSGMVTEADWDRWKHDDFTLYLDVVVETFGVEKLMFGSDWPVCLVAASYAETFGIVQDYFASFSVHEQEQFFGGNAASFYQLN